MVPLKGNKKLCKRNRGEKKQQKYLIFVPIYNNNNFIYTKPFEKQSLLKDETQEDDISL